MSMSKNMSKNS